MTSSANGPFDAWAILVQHPGEPVEIVDVVEHDEEEADRRVAAAHAEDPDAKVWKAGGIA